ncbi:DUF916 domain-containing protein [Saccharothrix sp. NRRL B-16314]|uniref:DUF916 domain-containing protein n=1 Tax=Saccharothrix sp. NRRL B-16314 TaxID=1463825 RepID=UPI000524D5A8|nr:DUF916 domain-containing protein [Saccharothrix sp. NRRL B-16314]
MPVLGRLLLCVTAVLLAAPVLPATAGRPLTPPGAAEVSWSVVPAAANGPDGRRAVDLHVGPGQRVTEHIAVTNHSARPVAFVLDANDGYLTDKGVFDMRSAEVTPVDGGSWITVPDTVTVDGGATTVVPVIVTAPDHATPGDHPAGVTASLDTASGQVRVRNRVGVRFDIRVTGDLTAELAVTNVHAAYEQTWNPFAAGTVHLRYDVVNNGNVRVAPDIGVTSSTLFADTTWTDTGAARSREVLPGGTRRFDHRDTRAWPFGRITTTVTVNPGADAAPVTVTVTTWALPVGQAVLLVLVVSALLAIRFRTRARRRRFDRLLAQARDEGRAEAAGSGPARP